MKKVFIEARSKGEAVLPADEIRALPKRVAIFTTVQYLDSIPGIKKQLSDAGLSPVLKRLKKAKYPAQLLGCSIKKIEGADCILFIGDGKFHPIALAVRNKIPLFIYSPGSDKIIRFDDAQLKPYYDYKKATLAKFYSSEEIGILVSVKPGQNRLKDAIKLKERLEKKDKHAYILLADNIDLGQLSNFTFIDSFVNTACPRIAIDDAKVSCQKIINIDDLENF